MEIMRSKLDEMLNILWFVINRVKDRWGLTQTGKSGKVVPGPSE